MSTTPPPADLRSADAEHLPQLLERMTVLLVGFCAALRPFAAGNPRYEPVTVLILLLAGFALVLWGIAAGIRGKVSVATTPLWLPLIVFAGGAALAINTAYAHGNGQIALDAGYAWAADVMLFFLVANHFNTPERFRFLVAIMLAGLTMTAVYAIYQRFYGIPYFLHILNKTPDSVTATAGNNPVYQAMLLSRAATLRATGAFGYPNALGGFCLLFMPLAVGIFEYCRSAKLTGQRVLKSIAILGLAGGVMSGSRAGFLAAKIIECVLLFRLLPAPRKSFAAVVWILGGVAVWTVGGGVVSLGIGKGLAAVFAAGTATGIGALAFTGIWAFEYAWLAKRIRAEGNLPAIIRRVGLVTIACIIIAAGALAYPPFWQGEPTSRMSKKIASVRGDLGKMITVRANYWRAGVGMVRDHPWRGVGLNNFGSVYPQYKTRTGWAVKRAHNHYLELTATGGLPLLLAFLGIWILYFRAGWKTENSLPQTSAEKSSPPPADWLRGWGIGFGVMLFVIVYGASGLLGGLSVEFFVVELFGKATDGSIRAETGSVLPLIIHGGVHFLLLPLAWLLTFMTVSRLNFPRYLAYLTPWIQLGVLGLLLHIFADMHFSSAGISTAFWLLAGLGLAASGKVSSWQIPPKRRGLVVAVWFGVTASVVMFGFRDQMNGGLAAHSAEARLAILNRERDPAERKKLRAAAQTAVTAALVLRPQDADLFTRRSELLLMNVLAEWSRQLPPRLSAWEYRRRRGQWLRTIAPQRKNIVLAACDAAVRYDPQSATRYAHRARVRADLYPQPRSKNIRKSLLDDWAQAMRLNPQRPAYCLRYAEVAFHLENFVAAKAALQTAITLQQTITDERARLSEKETRTLNDLLQLLRVKNFDPLD